MAANALKRPRTLEELIDALGCEGKKILVAGGTDLVIRLHREDPRNVTLIDLSAASFLRTCAMVDEELRIGAGLTMGELEELDLVRDMVPVLAKAAACLGSTQIRNLATLGGNVASAAQCADSLPALIVLEAEAELISGHGAVRRVPVAGLVLGIGKTSILQDEAITAFIIPAKRLGMAGGFGKVGSRKAVTIAKINGAGLFRFDAGRVLDARLAFGSLGERAFEAPKLARALIGLSLKELRSEDALVSFVDMVEEAIPDRSSLAYKRSAVRAVGQDIIEGALAVQGGR